MAIGVRFVDDVRRMPIDALAVKSFLGPEDDVPGNRVFQLTNVPRPVSLLQKMQRLLR